MGAYYDEIEIEDMAWDAEKKVYHYPCPCGDRFEISKQQLRDYEDIATCPSCSLIIRVVYDPLDFEDEDEDEDGDEEEEEEEETQSDSESEKFEDAMEKLTIAEVAAAA
ncbi:hypothetical protein D9758_015550 [Tetrapyrgos nigripes]|uniref:Diphthamide biosynthesis protein 3 n=1 Tax=Tetrapyrgos nigripes TaxID=182062 RepID=A0A8H5C3W6_9AGAR|nr:hypothetical protein D9758_018590 [Tetrapyrgos nigripes]KAF5334284.1 hypothetical protein D9758_015550 [Tetrapyrgos nigripes]